jgi:hypothetical protein
MADPLVDSNDSREVLRLVDEYCSTQRHPSLPKFTIHSHTHESWRNTPCTARAWMPCALRRGWEADLHRQGILQSIERHKVARAS